MQKELEGFHNGINATQCGFTIDERLKLRKHVRPLSQSGPFKIQYPIQGYNISSFFAYTDRAESTLPSATQILNIINLRKHLVAATLLDPVHKSGVGMSNVFEMKEQLCVMITRSYL